MNNSQRLLRILVVLLVAIMALFPPYLVRQRSPVRRWICYGPVWQPPYGHNEASRPESPYCDEEHGNLLLLLLQITALWMASSVLYTRLGSVGWSEIDYPEYSRP